MMLVQKAQLMALYLIQAPTALHYHRTSLENEENLQSVELFLTFWRMTLILTVFECKCSVSTSEKTLCFH